MVLTVIIIDGTAILEPFYGEHWVLVWIAVLYVALVASSAMWALQALAIKHSSPTTLSAFTPAQPITTAVIAVLFMSTSLSANQLIGSVIIVIGLYGVLYCKSTDVKPKIVQLLSESDLKDIIVASTLGSDVDVVVN